MMTLTDLMFWATVIPRFNEVVGRALYKLSGASDDKAARRATPSQPGRR